MKVYQYWYTFYRLLNKSENKFLYVKDFVYIYIITKTYNMIYKYDKNSLLFKKINSSAYIKTLGFFILMNIVSGYFMYTIGIKNTIKSMSAEEKIMLINESDPFTKNKMVDMLERLNISYPWIPMAQSMIETGQWKSDIFLENDNLFGMKEAMSRVTTATGTNKNHATYNTWRESIYDYGFYQSRYLGKIASEDDYYQYLAASYAEDPNYVNKIKIMIKRHDLKSLFK
jgi:hypothetical protein